MKSQIKSGIVAGILFLASFSLQAQDQWTNTLQFLGNWRGPATIVLGEDEFVVPYHFHFKSVADGLVISMDEWFSDPVLGNFKGANLLVLSATDGMIHWYSADNLGTAHDHIGEWSDNNHFHMEYETLIEGQVFLEVVDITLNSNNTKMEVYLLVTIDGVTVQIISGTMTRSNGNNALQISMEDRSPITEMEKEVLVFPNPSLGTVTVSSQEIIEEITVVNDSGFTVDEAKPGNETYSFQLQSPGTYLIRVKMGMEEITKTIIVKNQ